MKVGIIGQGAIAQYVMKHLDEMNIEIGAIIVRSKPEAYDQRIYIDNAKNIPDDVILMIDCAGPAALLEHGVNILEQGKDVITVSLGAMADIDTATALEQAAKNGNSKLHLASGAIGALDCLQSAKVGGLDYVTYKGRKPPLAWKGSPAETAINLDNLSEATAHYKGTARQAAITYPKNANVAAAVAMAGIGFDDTNVELIADPNVTSNIHEIEAKGNFGSFTFRIEGKALPDNPRSSALAAMSAVAAIKRQFDRIVI